MGLKEAREYIRKLHRLQDNPYNWPDYLTGLPDRAAVLKKIDEVYNKLDRYAVGFVRISNIHPYLLKYGDSKHAEIIQWAAAILKTTAEECKNGFVGAVGTHEFAVVCRNRDIREVLKKARALFLKKTKEFYSESDLERQYIFSFNRDGEKVFIGFMDLIYEVLEQPRVEKHNVIPYLARLCNDRETVEV